LSIILFYVDTDSNIILIVSVAKKALWPSIKSLLRFDGKYIQFGGLC